MTTALGGCPSRSSEAEGVLAMLGQYPRSQAKKHVSTRSKPIRGCLRHTHLHEPHPVLVSHVMRREHDRQARELDHELVEVLDLHHLKRRERLPAVDRTSERLRGREQRLWCIPWVRGNRLRRAVSELSGAAKARGRRAMRRRGTWHCQRTGTAAIWARSWHGAVAPRVRANAPWVRDGLPFIDVSGRVYRHSAWAGHRRGQRG